MADLRSACNDTCGCPYPCPGGAACRCVGGERTVMATTTAGGEHKKCSCGEHCGCNPCTTCTTIQITGTGKAFCKCGPNCTCVTCA